MIPTRKQAAEALLKELELTEGIKFTEKNVLSSTTASVCMDVLGTIQDPKLQKRVAKKQGIMLVIPVEGSTKPAFFSVREFLNLLPE